MKKFLLFFISLISIPSVYAHCPLCTAATGAAVAVARFYGINDAIVGLFIGAFAISTGLWISNILKKRKISFSYHGLVLSILSLIITIVSLYFGRLFDAPGSLLGMPTLLTGILIGSSASWLGHIGHSVLKNYNGEKNLVPLQGIITILLSLIVSVVIVGGLI
ncbi:hypothetical protein HY498_04585 [Candidatus Woesearchaeota archaeon]|nr:hypothetical protein [Candidatus Woesearchaeota archaeon]